MMERLESILLVIGIGLIFLSGALDWWDTSPEPEQAPNCIERLIEDDLKSVSYEYNGTTYYCIKRGNK